MSKFSTLLKRFGGLNPPSPSAPAVASAEERSGSLENPAVPLAFPVELEMDGLFGPTQIETDQLKKKKRSEA